MGCGGDSAYPTDYHVYVAKTKQGRNHMGIHPGRLSLGCVTVKAEMPYNDDPCWKKLDKPVDSGELKYKNQEFDGFLYVFDQ